MNRIYRVVWNRALGVAQVVWERAHAAHGRSAVAGGDTTLARRHPLALTCLAIWAMTAFATPALAACPAGSVPVSGTGSNGSDGSAGYIGDRPQYPVDSLVGGPGGTGGNGYTEGAGTSPCVLIGNAVIGGKGGKGGKGGILDDRMVFAGGAGGTGGAGVFGSDFTLTNDGSISGGAGGAGGDA